MRKLCVVCVALAAAACGRRMTVELTTKVVHVPVGGEQQITLRLHDAPGAALPQLTSDAPASVSLYPNVLASAEGDQLISVSAVAGATPGVSHTTLTVTAGTQVATVPLDIEVIDAQAFALSLDPPVIVVRQGHSANATASVKNAAMHSATGPVVVTVEGTLPAGMHVTGSTVTLSGDAAANGTLSIAADPQVAAATTPLTLVATQGSLRAQLDFQVMVLDAHSPDFTLQAPSTLAVRRGGGAPLAVHVTPQMGFSDMVSVTAVNPPAGITVSTATATVDAPAQLNVTTDGTVAAGNVQLFLTGTAGPLVHQVKVTLHVTDSGTVDGMFGMNGLAPLSSIMGSFNALSAFPDGRVIAVGSGNNGAVAVRLTGDGALDPAFGQGGIAMVNLPGTSPAAMAVVALEDGSSLVAGYAYDSSSFDYLVAVAKLKDDGSVDTTWGQQGFFTDTQNAYPLRLNVLADGSVLVSIIHFDSSASTDTAVFTHLTPAGALDTGFGTGGSVTFPNSYAMGAQELADGTLALLTGTVTSFGDENAPTVTWLSATGQLATAFGNNGTTALDVGTPTQLAYRIQARPDASLVLVVVGDMDTQLNDPKTFVVQLTPAGLVDTTFGADGSGRVSFPMLSMGGVLAPDGSAIVVGCKGSTSTSFVPVAVRVTAGGTPDPTFQDAESFGVGVIGADPGCASDAALQPSGRIVIGGNRGTSFTDGWFVTRLAP